MQFYTMSSSTFELVGYRWAIACRSGLNGTACKATDVYNNYEGIVALLARHGNYYAPQLAQPVWVQLRFPMPSAAAQVTLRFSMDRRYCPNLRGGNPCLAAQSNSSHQCELCNGQGLGLPWDHNVEAGVHLLWSTPGADRHVISGPVDAMSLWLAGTLSVTVDSPPELNLTGSDEVIVTLMAFNQYMYTGMLIDVWSVNYSPRGWTVRPRPPLRSI